MSLVAHFDAPQLAVEHMITPLNCKKREVG